MYDEFFLTEPMFKNIPQLTNSGTYQVHVPWTYLNSWNSDLVKDVDPEFQRAHVWSERQQIAYVEFVLRGGHSSKDLYWNCIGWMGSRMGDYPLVLVDGKQRHHAVQRFMHNEIRVFGYYFNQFTDRLPLDAAFIMHVNNLPSYAHVLQWYIELNAGGVAHTDEEIEKVRNLLTHEREKNAANKR